MNLKQILSLIGAVSAVLLITLAALGLITWKLFWIAIILIAGFAYYVMPRMSDK